MNWTQPPLFEEPTPGPTALPKDAINAAYNEYQRVWLHTFGTDKTGPVTAVIALAEPYLRSAWEQEQRIKP